VYTTGCDADRRTIRQAAGISGPGAAAMSHGSGGGDESGTAGQRPAYKAGTGLAWRKANPATARGVMGWGISEVYRSEWRRTIGLGVNAHRCAEQPGNIPCMSRAHTPRPAGSRLRGVQAPEEMMRSGSAAFPAAKRAVKYASTGSTAHVEETSRGVVLALTRPRRRLIEGRRAPRR
jgi:hypothetical protein